MVSKQAQLKYLNRRLDEMAALEDLLEQKNFPEAELLCHNVVGSAEALSFTSLSRLAMGLEHAIRTLKPGARAQETRVAFEVYRRVASELKDEVVAMS